jgi:hypothetical protein
LTQGLQKLSEKIRRRAWCERGALPTPRQLRTLAAITTTDF